MEIKKDIKNDLLGRREVEIILEAGKTPSFQESAKLIAEHFKSNEENIMVEKIKGSFGKSRFVINASIYNTKEAKEEAEKRLIKKKVSKQEGAAA